MDLLEVFNEKWGKGPDLAKLTPALESRLLFRDTMETARNRYQVSKAPVQAGIYRKIAGNEALVYGLVAGKTGDEASLWASCSRITILEGLSALKRFGVRNLQQRMKLLQWEWQLELVLQEIYQLLLQAVRNVSKSEVIGLASITELPVMIVDVQRGGPSTGLPTSLNKVTFFKVCARHGDCPLPGLLPTLPLIVLIVQ